MLQYVCYGRMGLGVGAMALDDLLTGGAMLVVGVVLHIAMGH